jgi:ACR3 family arsenite efflux pump ArsB
VATGIALFGPDSGAALAIVVGAPIEVLVMFIGLLGFATARATGFKRPRTFPKEALQLGSPR